jgi:hypothetical protein
VDGRAYGHIGRSGLVLHQRQRARPGRVQRPRHRLSAVRDARRSLLRPPLSR